MNQPGQPLTKDQFETLISNECRLGQQYVYGPDRIAADRDRNFDYARGIMNDVPVTPGRSALVDMTVRAYIDLMKPSLIRIFTSGRNIGEYVTAREELIDMVKLATRYVNDVVLRKDNRGELMLNDWAEDGLIQKLGTVMGYWEERWETQDQVLEGIPDQGLAPLLLQIQAQGGEVIEHSADQSVANTPLGPVPTQVHSIKVRTKVNKSKCCIDVIPPEEYIISRDARNDDDAIMEAHRTGVEVGYLVSQGLPLDILNSLPAYADPYPDRMQKYNQDYLVNGRRDNTIDPMLKKVGVIRGRIKCDYDGTGLKDWFFIAGGDISALKLLADPQPYDYQVFFANFCPQPIPHTVYGRCPGDDLAPVQKARTVLLRQMMDTTYLSNVPQREVVADWIVKPDQLMNMSPGAPVLVKQPNAIREIQIPFIGDKILLMMQYFEGEAELRSGVGRNTAGLDPEALTNQSATANNNMFSAMQGRTEMIARVWAQGGMRKLFRGILQCITKYQDFARVVQIDGKPVTIDPRQWKDLDELEVNINTGLGTGNRDRDLMVLKGIEAAQKEVLSTLGPGNPIVDFKQIVRTYQLECEAAGISYPENFFSDPPDGYQGPQPQPPQPTPDTMVLAQVEQAKLAEKERESTAKNDLDREIAIAEIASRERIGMDKNAKDYALGLQQLGIQHATVIVQAAKVDAENIRNDMMAKSAA